MNIRYRNDLYGNYMLVEIPEKEDTSQYPYKMLLKNRIYGVLSYKERMEDGKSYLYVDISQKRSLLQEYREKEMQLEDMTLLFQEIIRILEEIKVYLLHENMVNLNPEYIFWDREEQRLYLLILPWISEQKTCNKLAEFFLEKINHKDENGVNAAYNFYRQQSQPQFSLFQFVSILEKESILKRQRRKEKEEKIEIPVNIKEEYERKNKDPETDFECNEKTEHKQNERKVHTWSIKISILILSFVFLGLSIIPIISAPLKLSCLSLAVLLLLLFFISLLKTEKESDKVSLPIQEIEIDMQETVFFNANESEDVLKLEWKERGRRKQYSLKELPCTVGKIKEEVSLVISDISVSRVHCKFIEKDHKICIMDLNSTNGTYLNGLPVKNGEIQEIEKNDEILIGKVKISVV